MTPRFLRPCLGAVALLITSFAAQAADLPQSYKAPAYVAPAYSSWNGFYVGINGGYGMGKANVSTTTGTTGDFNANGALAGVTAGYNFQTGTWVWGVEADLDWTGMKGDSTTFCAPHCTVSVPWLGTARVRLGYAGWNNWLPYLTGGLAAGSVKFEQGSTTNSQTQLGWTAGVGVEYAMFTNWSVKLEYLYANLGTADCPAGTCNPTQEVDTKFKANLVRVGVNYRF